MVEICDAIADQLNITIVFLNNLNYLKSNIERPFNRDATFIFPTFKLQSTVESSFFYTGVKLALEEVLTFEIKSLFQTCTKFNSHLMTHGQTNKRIDSHVLQYMQSEHERIRH